MAVYWILAFALAWLITVPPALAQHGLIGASPVPAGLGLLIGLAPAIATAVAVRRAGARGFWRAALTRRGTPALAALALLMPPALLAIVYAVSAARGAPIRVALGADVAVFGLLWLVLAFTEEVGWRGYALPRLARRHRFWAGSLILGLAWCVWHYPKLLASPYLGSFAEAAPLIAIFSVQIVIANFILCWLYVRSGESVLIPTLYHASFNTVATAYFLAAADLLFTALLAAVALAIALRDKGVRAWAPADLPSEDGRTAG
jgi:membrane protease YdiL (CAAX protease family)